MTKEKYLITGASGFIGGAILNKLTGDGIPCVGIGRRIIQRNNYVQCNLLDSNGLRLALQGVTSVIHCAGYAHAFKSKSSEVYERTWLTNYDGTKNLIEIAVEMKINKFINFSSVKAMSDPGCSCVDEGWELNPISEYGKSKLAAEKLLFEVCKKNSIDIVNLRLSMVYGFGGRGNLERMSELIRKRIFPPIPETNNFRSLVHVHDVLDAVMHVANDDRAFGETYIISGRESVSGRGLYDEIRKIYGYKKLSFEIPEPLLRCASTIFQIIENKTGLNMPFNNEILSRLFDSAWYSTKKIEDTLGWYPKVDLEFGLREMLRYNTK